MVKKNIMNFTIAQEYLARQGGEYAVDVVRICERKRGPVTDEQIGKKLKDLKITEIRTTLNKLHYLGIAIYQKTRNQKTGWYSYTWEIKRKRIVELLLEEWRAELNRLEEKLEFERNYVFFGCSGTGCKDEPFEVAAEYQFKCPRCGEGMKGIDSGKRTRLIQKRVDLIRNESADLEKLI